MKKLFLVLSAAVMLLALAACSGESQNIDVAPRAAEPDESQPEAAVANDEPVVAEATAEDDKNIMSGKPQLIEFYADW